MPEGVEHDKLQLPEKLITRVIVPLMPEGVEQSMHSLMSRHRARDRSFDAGRR